MGRKERRELEKKVRHLSKTKPWEVQAMIGDAYKREVIESRLGNEVLAPGDKVMLDYEKIFKDPDWENFQPEYQKFVKENANRVFTLKKEAKAHGPFAFVSFEEDDTWMWFTGFVKKVRSEE